jgi:hypothetical protein
MNMTDITNYGDIILRDLAARHGTFFNPVASDANGARDILLDFKGKDSLNNIHQMVRMDISHDGVGTDYKGKYVLSVNDGDDVIATPAMTVTSSATTLHSDASVSGNMTVTGTSTVGTGLTVSAGGATITGASTFADTVTINGTGTALDVATGDMNVAGNLTVGSFTATTYNGLDLDDVGDTTTRFAIDNTFQDFTSAGLFAAAGANPGKQFWDLRAAREFHLGVGGTHASGNFFNNYLHFKSVVRVRFQKAVTMTDVLPNDNSETFGYDAGQQLLISKTIAPWVSCVRSDDQAGSNGVVLGRFTFSGKHTAETGTSARMGAEIRAVTSSSEWSGSDTTIAPTEIQFFTQNGATGDQLTSPVLTIDSDGKLLGTNNFTTTGQIRGDKATGHSIVAQSIIKANSYVECTGINVLSGGTNSIAGDTTVTGALTVTSNTGSSITVDGSAPVNITPNVSITGTLGVAGALSATLGSGTGLSVTADASIGGALTVSGAAASSFGGALNLTKASGTGLDVTADALVGGALTVTGALGVTGNLTGVNITSSGVLTASGPNTALVVSNNATVGGTFTATGATSVGALTGTSTASFTGLVSCDASTGTGLSVNKNATIGGTIAVTGTSTLTGAVTASSTITAAGAITCNEAVTNVGIRNEGISELVGIVKCLEPTGTGLDVTNHASIRGLLTLHRVTTPGMYALDCVGNAKFQDDAEISQNLTVTGTSGFTGLLTGVQATFSDVVTANKSSGTGLVVTNSATVGGTFTVSGASTLNSGSVTNALSVGGLITASGAGTGLTVTNNAAVGGTLTVTGATTINGALDVNAASDITSLTISGAGTALNVTDGATIGGSLVVSGNLTVSGTTTTVNTETLTVTDNIIVVNESPIASKDSGIVMQRFVDDIVTDSAKESGTLDGAGSLEATLPTGLVGATDSYYAGWYIKITNDSPAGALNQARKITGYTHSTRVITVDADWSVYPDATSTFSLYNRPFVGFNYDESADEFALVATALDPTDTIAIQEYLNIHVNNVVTAGNTSLGGDLVLGSLTITEPSDIEFQSSSPAVRFKQSGNDKLVLDTPTSTMYGGWSMNDGKLTLNATTGDCLTVTQGSMNVKDVALTGQLNITGGSTISAWLTVTTGIQANGVIRAYGSGTCLDATGDVVISGAGSLDCDGAADFASTVNIQGALTGTSGSLSTTLGVTGVATFTAQSVHTNGINAGGSSDIDTLVVSGAGTALTVTNDISARKLILGAGGLTSAGHLNINNTSDFANTLTISKATGTGLSVVANSTLSGVVTCGGDVGISGTLTGVAATFSGTLTASGAGGASITNNLTAGSITTAGTLTISSPGDLDCNGAADFATTVNIVGALSGTSATLSTTLGVTGVATFTAQSVHNGGIDVNAASDIISLTVSGAGTALSVTNNASVGGTLAVTGTSTHTGLSTFNGGIDVNAASDITSLTVSGAGTALTVSNTASVGALSVSGATTLTGVVTMPAGFDSNAASTVDKLTIDGVDAVTLVVDQGATIGTTLGVTGVATFTAQSVHSGGISSTSGDFSELITSTRSGPGIVLEGQAIIKDWQRTGLAIDGTRDPKVQINSKTSSPADIVLSIDNANTIVNAQDIGLIEFSGRDNGTLRKAAWIVATAANSWSNVSPSTYKAPSRIDFFVEDSTEFETTSPAFRIDRGSSAGIYLYENAVLSQNLTATGTMDITGASTITSLTASGAVHLTASGTALDVDANMTVGGTSTLTTVSAVGTVTMLSTCDVSGTVSCNKGSGTGLAVTSDATVGGDLTITGNLIVNGTTTTIDTATLAVEDHNIELGAVTTPTDSTADGGGITLKGATDKTITYDNTNTSWDMSEHVNVVTGKEYRINDVSKLTNTTVYLGAGAGDGIVYMGDNTTNGSWRIDVDGNGDLRFSKREAGSWVTKQTIG